MTSIVCEEGMEKMGKRLNFWTHDNRFLKGLVDSMVERLQFKEIYGDVTRGQENVQPSRLVLADLHVSKGNMG